MALQAVLFTQDPKFYWQNEIVTPVSKKATALLIYLVSQTESSTREQLAELLWGVGKLNSVRQALYELRQLKGSSDWLHDDPERVKVSAKTDAQVFEQALTEEQYEDAVKIYQSSFLSNFSLSKTAVFTDWLELERMRYAELHYEAQTALLAQLERQERFSEALKLAETLLSKDALNETAHRVIMRLHYKNGNQEAALEQFEQLREKLQQELNVEPLQETLELLAEIEGGSATARQAVLLKQGDSVPSSAETFMGRSALKQEILDTLKQNTSILIQGFGGMGKTALAAEVTKNYLTQDKTALWLETGSDSFENTLDALVRPFNANQDLSQTKNKKALIQKLLEENNVSLIILDDLRNAYTLIQLNELLPQTLPLLISSRSRYPRIKRIYLDRLERNESLDLLSHHAQKNLNQNKHADQLANQLGDHAFALRLAGITLKQEKTTAQQLLKRISKNPLDLKLPPELNESGKESIATLLDASLSPLNDAEYEAFLAFGALPTPSATPDLITRLTRRETEETEDALFTLSTRGLAQRQTQAGNDQISYRLHDLAHAYAHANTALRPQSTQRAALEYLITHKDNIDAVETELNNLLSAAETSEVKDLVNYMRLLTVDGTYYTARGHSSRSVKLLQRAIDQAIRLDDLINAQYFIGKLADYLQNYSNDYEGALDKYLEAIDIAKRMGDHSRQGILLGLCAVVYTRKNDYVNARKYLSLAHSEAEFSQDALTLCAVLDQMGYVSGMIGELEDASDYFKRSLQVASNLMKSSQYPDSEIGRRQFFAIGNLAEVEFLLGNISKALELRKQALKLAVENRNDLWQADAHYDLAELFHELSESQQAQCHFDYSLSFYSKSKANVFVDKVKTIMKEKGYI